MAARATPSRRRARARDVFLALGLFLLVCGGKLAVLEHFDSDLPFWDQWDAIGGGVIHPYLEGHLGFGDLFVAHNEHRIVCTRLLALGLFVLNGQWDARLDSVVNAALHAAIAVMVFFWGRARLPRRWQGVWFAVVAALIAPPVVWENIIHGFDSQQYFLIGFSLATIGLLVPARAGTIRWGCGAACAVVALFTMGSGLMAAIATAAALICDGRPHDVWGRHRWTLLVCGAVAVAGVLLYREVPHHQPYAAQTLEQFLLTFWHNLQWPLVHFGEFPLFGWAPWCWLAWRVWRRRGTTDATERVLFAVGLWALAHYAAQAYARGTLNPWPAPRSLENNTVGVGANVLILLLALSRHPLTGAARWWRTGTATIGAAIGAYGLGSIIHENSTWVLPMMNEEIRRHTASVRAFVLTDDATRLRAGDIPYPHVEGMVFYAGMPRLREVMPASIRRPLAMAGTARPAESFVVEGIAPDVRPTAGAPVPGSFTADGLPSRGAWHSEPIAPGRHRYWFFSLAGIPDATDVELVVTSAAGAPLARLRPTAAAPDRWQTHIIPAPETPAALVARDDSSDGWLAFFGPTGMATGSYFARWLTRQGMPVILLGLLCCGGGWILAAQAPPRSLRAAALPEKSSGP